jgi:NOL1/NOP2/fmu family ribosome biogenesis protein
MIKESNNCYLFEGTIMQQYVELSGFLNIIYKGIFAGEMVRDKLIPSHALAMSTIDLKVPSIELDYLNAIKYLQKQDADINSQKTGWQLITYDKKNLGWVNVLPNRVNNYYPKELRILKQSPSR